MRYLLSSGFLSLKELHNKAVKAGAANLVDAPALGMVFCDLIPEQIQRLSEAIRVKKVNKVQPQVIPPVVQAFPTDAYLDLLPIFEEIRSYFSPPLTGNGLTVALLDSGIRGSHESLQGKVIYEANFTDSPTTEDVYDHGTGVAYIVARVVAPGASLLNVKVLQDDGEGTEEEVVLGLDAVCSLVTEARNKNKHPLEPEYPNVVNMSLGAKDSGDPDSAVRLACRKAVEDYGLEVIAAAGNYGDAPSTITEPATEPDVVAIGALNQQQNVWRYSSRGPTLEGVIKPDFVFWGEGLYLASCKSDTAYVAKSGTSFSAPAASGFSGLIWETGRRVYGDSWGFNWKELMAFAPYFCIKAEGAPVRKDNSWGYGMPAVATFLGQLARPTTPLTEAVNAIVPVLSLAFMMTLFRGIRF